MVWDEVRLDRDATVFDITLHDGQYPIHLGRARFYQVLEGISVKRLVGKRIVRSDFVGMKRYW